MKFFIVSDCLGGNVYEGIKNDFCVLPVCIGPTESLYEVLESGEEDLKEVDSILVIHTDASFRKIMDLVLSIRSSSCISILLLSERLSDDDVYILRHAGVDDFYNSLVYDKNVFVRIKTVKCWVDRVKFFNGQLSK